MAMLADSERNVSGQSMRLTPHSQRQSQRDVDILI